MAKIEIKNNELNEVVGGDRGPLTGAHQTDLQSAGGHFVGEHVEIYYRGSWSHGGTIDRIAQGYCNSDYYVYHVTMCKQSEQGYNGWFCKNIIEGALTSKYEYDFVYDEQL